jgi:hypothetical protein
MDGMDGKSCSPNCQSAAGHCLIPPSKRKLLKVAQNKNKNVAPNFLLIAEIDEKL